jgi:hypothetical protein
MDKNMAKGLKSGKNDGVDIRENEPNYAVTCLGELYNRFRLKAGKGASPPPILFQVCIYIYM